MNTPAETAGNVPKRVIEHIQRLIMNGELLAGSKLPSERQLAEQLDVGRSSVREALKALEILGLVERRHGQGNFVARQLNSNYFQPLALAFKLDGGRLQDVVVLRNMVEEYAVSQACENITQEGVKQLRRLQKNMVAARGVEAKAECDALLHRQITHICGNKLIVDVLESVSALTDALTRQAVYSSLFEDQSIQQIYDEHNALIDAIEKRDKPAAITTTRRHIMHINGVLLRQEF